MYTKKYYDKKLDDLQKRTYSYDENQWTDMQGTVALLIDLMRCFLRHPPKE